MRVVIVDDSEDIRELLELVVTVQSGWEIVGRGANGLDAVSLAASQHPDMILLDASMPILDGLSALPQIKDCSPGTQVVIVSAHPQADLRDSALSAGALGCIEKSNVVTRLVPSVTALLAQTELLPRQRAAAD